MSFADNYGVEKQNPFTQGYPETFVPIHGRNREVANGDRVRNIHMLASLWFQFKGWLNPFFSETKSERYNPVEEYDPYIGSLLNYLRGEREWVKQHRIRPMQYKYSGRK